MSTEAARREQTEIPAGFTVVGIYRDNMQRWAEHYAVATPQEAERLVGGELLIAGVIVGNHPVADLYAGDEGWAEMRPDADDEPVAPEPGS